MKFKTYAQQDRADSRRSKKDTTKAGPRKGIRIEDTLEFKGKKISNW
jgi:hypothetical protein